VNNYIYIITLFTYVSLLPLRPWASPASIIALIIIILIMMTQITSSSVLQRVCHTIICWVFREVCKPECCGTLTSENARNPGDLFEIILARVQYSSSTNPPEHNRAKKTKKTHRIPKVPNGNTNTTLNLHASPSCRIKCYFLLRHVLRRWWVCNPHIQFGERALYALACEGFHYGDYLVQGRGAGGCQVCLHANTMNGNALTL
jgi:hypothetical protein